MLLVYGNATVPSSWVVDEKIPTGYCRVYHIHSGEVTYTDEVCRKQLLIGHLYIFPSASVYKMVQNPLNPLRCTYLHLDLFPIHTTELIDVEVAADSFLESLLAAITKAIDDENSKIVSSLADAFALFCTEHEIIVPPLLAISKIMLYIAENINRQVTVTELSRLIGYNPQYFIRLFHQTVGTTPRQYIINFRLKEAVRLLKTNVSISEVAEMTGYGDLKTFGRSFKAKFGVTPTQFRRIYTPLP